MFSSSSLNARLSKTRGKPIILRLLKSKSVNKCNLSSVTVNMSSVSVNKCNRVTTIEKLENTQYSKYNKFKERQPIVLVLTCRIPYASTQVDVAVLSA